MADREAWKDDPDLQLSDIELDAMLFRARSHGIDALLAEPEAKDGILGCWVGGLPSLPPEVPWPYHEQLGYESDEVEYSVPMQFIAQFDLAQMPRLVRAPKLPDQGMLYFFYDPLMLGDGGGKVLYLPDATHGNPLRPAPPMPEKYRLELSHATEGAPPEKIERINVKQFQVYEAFNLDYIASNDFAKGIEEYANTVDCKPCSFSLLFGPLHTQISRSHGKLDQDFTRLLTIDANNEIGIRNPSSAAMIFWIGEDDLENEKFSRVILEESGNG